MYSRGCQKDNPDHMHFPTLYQAQHADYSEDIPFWLELARNQGEPVLELGCGPGRVLVPLANAGYSCIGLDNDLDMVLLLKNNILSQQLLGVKAIVADITSIPLSRTFPLIIIPCNTYSTLNKKTRETLLKYAFNHLTFGGVFTVSVPNPYLLINLDSTTEADFEEYFPHPITNYPVQVTWQIFKKRDCVLLIWHYDHMYPDGNVERLDIQVLHGLITKDQYLSEFEAAGLTVTSLYGDFLHSPYSEDSPYLIIMTQR